MGRCASYPLKNFLYTGAMSNEILFILHSLFVLAVSVGALLLGRGALSALICLYYVFANLFVVKKMLLCGWLASGSDMYVVGSIAGILMGDVVWGKDFGRSIVWPSILIALFFFLLSWFQVAYQASSFDYMGGVFAQILSSLPRVTLFSVIAHAVAQQVTLFCSYFFSALSGNRAVGLTSFAALILGQLVDAGVFFGGVFGSQLPLSEIIQLIMTSTGLKVFVIACSSVLVSAVAVAKERGYV